MGAAGGEELEAAISADTSSHERGTLGIRPLNGGDGSVDEDTKHSRRTRDGMQSIHGDSVSSGTLLGHCPCCRLLPAFHAPCRPGCARCLCLLLLAACRWVVSSAQQGGCCYWVWHAGGAPASHHGAALLRQRGRHPPLPADRADMEPAGAHTLCLPWRARTAPAALPCGSNRQRMHALCAAAGRQVFSSSPCRAVACIRSRLRHAPLQVSDPSCCDYDKRTPL